MKTIDCASSSNLASATYEPEAGELRVSYKDGSTYIYENVPPGCIADMELADSKGSFIHKFVKPFYSVQRLN